MAVQNRRRVDSDFREIWHNSAQSILTDVKVSENREKALRKKRVDAGKANALPKKRRLNGEAPEAKLSQCPYDKPESVLKREVYRFVHDNISTETSNRFEAAIEETVYKFRTPRIGFAENPYHLIFRALRSKKLHKYPLDIKAYEITRFSRQLVYARRHNICPDLLIGFLYQTGSPDEISKKAMNPDQREDWYLAKIGKAKANMN